MKIELVALSAVKPYPNNPRLNDDAVDAVAASLREFGFRQPLVVDGDLVIICRRYAGQRFGLGGENEIREAFRQEVHHRLGLLAGGGAVHPAIPIEDLLFVLDPGDPKLRDAAGSEFPFRVLGVFGEDQGLEAVFPVERPRNPGPAPARRLAADLFDFEVVSQFAVFFVRVHLGSPWLVVRFSLPTDTHEPCGRKNIKRGQARIPQVFSAKTQRRTGVCKMSAVPRD